MPARNRHRELVKAGLIPPGSTLCEERPRRETIVYEQYQKSELVMAEIHARSLYADNDVGKWRPAVYVGCSERTGSHLVGGLTTLPRFDNGEPRTPYTGWQSYGMTRPGFFWGGNLVWVRRPDVNRLWVRAFETSQLLTHRDWSVFCEIHGEQMADVIGPDYRDRLRS